MLQKFKNIFPWILIIALSLMLWSNGRDIEVLKDNIRKNESIIDSLRSVVIKEESIVDSFSSKRTSIQEQRDSSFNILDTLGVPSCVEILKRNIYEYAKTDTTNGPFIFKPDK